MQNLSWLSSDGTLIENTLCRGPDASVRICVSIMTLIDSGAAITAESHSPKTGKSPMYVLLSTAAVAILRAGCY